MKKVYFDGITGEYGCCIKDAMVTLNDDYTMNQLVNAIKDAGYQMFKLPTMHRFCKI